GECGRGAGPLGESIARTVAGDLAVLLGSDVAPAPFANFDPTYRVTIDVQRFESVRGESALVEAVWVVRAAAGGATRTGRTVARGAGGGEGCEGPPPRPPPGARAAGGAHPGAPRARAAGVV